MPDTITKEGSVWNSIVRVWKESFCSAEAKTSMFLRPGNCLPFTAMKESLCGPFGWELQCGPGGGMWLCREPSTG